MNSPFSHRTRTRYDGNWLQNSPVSWGELDLSALEDVGHVLARSCRSPSVRWLMERRGNNNQRLASDERRTKAN